MQPRAARQDEIATTLELACSGELEASIGGCVFAKGISRLAWLLVCLHWSNFVFLASSRCQACLLAKPVAFVACPWPGPLKPAGTSSPAVTRLCHTHYVRRTKELKGQTSQATIAGCTDGNPLLNCLINLRLRLHATCMTRFKRGTSCTYQHASVPDKCFLDPTLLERHVSWTACTCRRAPIIGV